MSPHDVPRREHGTSLLRTPAALVATLAVVLLAVLLVPGGRHQLALSVQREPAGYLAVFFSRHQHTPRCDAAGRRVDVRFAVRSHLARSAVIRYVVGVAPGGAAKPRTGQVRLAPGEVAHVRRTVLAPQAHRFRIVVSLPGRAERLRLRCRPPRGKP